MWGFRDGPNDSNRDDRNAVRTDAHAREDTDEDRGRACTSAREARRRWGEHATENGPEKPTEPEGSPYRYEMYGTFDDSVGTVVYDEQDPDAWVRSSVAVKQSGVR